MLHAVVAVAFPLLIVLLVALIVWALLVHLRSSIWNPLARAFPPRPPAHDAVRRQFQSLSLSQFNLGWMTHITVDDECLHLEPAAIGRWIGLKSLSIPWEEIQPIRPALFGRWRIVRVRGTTIQGPAWCLSLAGERASRAPADG